MGIRGNNISHQPHDSEKLMSSHTNAASHQYSVAMLIEKRSMQEPGMLCLKKRAFNLMIQAFSILLYLIKKSQLLKFLDKLGEAKHMFIFLDQSSDSDEDDS